MSASVSNSVSFNAVSGTLFKSVDGSFFLRFNLGSEMADNLLCGSPKYVTKEHSYAPKVETPVVVLQTMLVGDGLVLAEIVPVEHYEELKRSGVIL